MTALDTDTKQNASLALEEQRAPLTESLSGYNLLEHKDIADFVRRKDTYVRQVRAHISQALERCQEAMQETDFIEEEREYLQEGLDREVLILKCFEFFEELSHVKKFANDPKDAMSRKLARMFGVKGRELTDDDVKLGEQLRDLGNRIFGGGFKSITPSIILREELGDVIGDIHPDPEALRKSLEARRNAHAKQYYEAMGVRSRESLDGSTVFEEIPKSIDVEESSKSFGGKGSLSLRYRIGLRRAQRTPEKTHDFASGPDKKKSQVPSKSKQSKKVLELMGKLQGGYARMIKSHFFKNIGPGIEGMAKSLRVLQKENALAVDPELLVRFDQWSTSFEKGINGDSNDYRESVDYILDNVAELQEDLLAIADELERSRDNLRHLRLSESQRELEELALTHTATIEERVPIQVMTFTGRDDRSINSDLIHAVCEYNFALEQGDDARAEKSFRIADGFQRREVREALQVLYFDRGLIAESTYQTLREECGEHREAPVKPPEFTEEELAAQQEAEDEKREQIALSEMALAEYCDDPEECARLAQIVLPETIDSVLVNLANGLQGPELRDLLLKENPRIFEIAQVEEQHFKTYSYKLLMHTADVMRRYKAGELDLARYSDPYTITDVIEADQKSEERQVRRESIARSLEANGFSFDAVSAIFLIGFADGDGGLHTSATGHVSQAAVFENLTAGLSNYADYEPLLREEFTKLMKANAIVGSSSVAISTNWAKKKATPNPAILKHLIQFLLEEETPQLPVTLALE